MRPFVVIAAVLSPTVANAAETLTAAPLSAAAADFQLGGAASRAALAPDVGDDPTPVRRRLSLPYATESVQSQQTTTIGPATIYLGEGLDAGRDTLQMGTFLKRGQARAGVSVTYLEIQEEVARSEVFVDYSLTENLSVGLSGILNSEIDEGSTVPQIGLSAEYTTDSGAYLQGGFAGADAFEPVFGLSLGLRF